jgi:hypothetical protein
VRLEVPRARVDRSGGRRVLLLGLAGVLLAGCSTTTAEPPADATLDSLTVKGRAAKTGYSREEFGGGWVDTDRNGCDTRNDVLARDLVDVRFRPGTQDCVVLTGTLVDPYGGSTISFTRGEGTSEAVQIDHVVALSDAWQKGAQSWDEAKRTEFANDPLELLAVDGPTNSAKGDGDAATWLPPDKGFRCAYVRRQIDVKAKYGLWVTRAENDAMAAVLADCSSTTGPSTAVAFATCAEARAAGASPLHRGDPGYRSSLDGDGDGVACE